MLPANNIQRIRFFTARVVPRPHDPTQAQRQQIYLRALATIPHLTIHYGKFLTQTIELPLVNPAPTGQRMARVLKTEEKGSDVNLATFLLLDAFRSDCEVAVVISGDTDLVEPIRVVRDELRVRVGVLNPHSRRSAELRGAATFYRHRAFDAGTLARCQFAPILRDSHGTITKPLGW